MDCFNWVIAIIISLYPMSFRYQLNCRHLWRWQQSFLNQEIFLVNYKEGRPWPGFESPQNKTAFKIFHFGLCKSFAPLLSGQRYKEPRWKRIFQEKSFVPSAISDLNTGKIFHTDFLCDRIMYMNLYESHFIRSVTRSQNGSQYMPQSNWWAAYLGRTE